MERVTLGGRAFWVRPLTVGDGLEVYGLGLPESDVALAMLARALVPEPNEEQPTVAWLRALPLTEMGQVVRTLRAVREEAGMTATTFEGPGPGEAASPPTP